ncbi:alpha-1,6-mannosyltransferase subunit [Coccidioides immitis RS]|uniref:Alpha-1,6-mannosyltransferase subunit n=2 Tax=Coccidioides immitis TaxID=5501 RepID=J3K8W1_COCIM|nr:alpha-1,6-mannosyltransferase subunit [Coccidioides immitis RS]EAS31295.3 alpha-1,6-mannosyltransferase subunit [Coccidioides immitis RS]KMU86083.1 initiation-specific alpha-1,6-mannosyltransferase [Coccidioides immitis H538.4]TPX24120.1 membrane-bound alpha-1,6- mannosyltransferase Initiation-specific [Coccidioides immitis]
MISFRRCLIIAATFLAFMYILHLSGSGGSTRQPEESNAGPEDKLSSADGSLQFQPQQIPLEDLARKPVRERLRYQFPYDIQSKFPAYIWQTWKYTPASGKFKEELRPFEASWTEHHPGFVHQVITDDGLIYVVKYLYAAFPEIIEAFESMPLPVLKADYFRYLILLARGGIYSDIDTFALKPATEWVPAAVDRTTIGLIIGIEADPDRKDWQTWYSRRIQFCQWTIQSKPGHPILRDVVANITEEALRMKSEGKLKKNKMDKTIVEFTGPAVWTDSIFRYFNNPNYFDMGRRDGNSTSEIGYKHFTGMVAQKAVGDVVVLPITSFSPGVRQMGAEEPEHPMAFVKHNFQGAWKTPKA